MSRGLHPRASRALRTAAVMALAVLTGCGSASLAEPEGTPDASAAPALFVAGLGDSVMSSSGCGCDDPATQYAALLGQRDHRTVDAANLGGNGETAANLADALRDDSETRSVVRRADVVMVIIGANDVTGLARDWDNCRASCWAPSLDALRRNMGNVLDGVDQLRRSKDVPVLVSDYWNVLEDGQVAVNSYGRDRLAWSLQLTDAVNAVIQQEAKGHGATVVDVDGTFHGASGNADATTKLLEDGDHPNAAGVKGIAEDFLAATPKSRTD